mmetsp:Transcript_71173/g.114865  ORF Transcript_71173/g.114865 Transcript_71173/m.114865 type:complete len:223 (+) Transcript_71173:986-1654(+)
MKLSRSDQGPRGRITSERPILSLEEPPFQLNGPRVRKAGSFCECHASVPGLHCLGNDPSMLLLEVSDDEVPTGVAVSRPAVANAAKLVAPVDHIILPAQLSADECDAARRSNRNHLSIRNERHHRSLIDVPHQLRVCWMLRANGVVSVGNTNVGLTKTVTINHPPSINWRVANARGRGLLLIYCLPSSGAQVHVLAANVAVLSYRRPSHNPQRGRATSSRNT